MFVFPILRRIWILTFLREILNLSIIQFREIKHFQIAIFEACKIFPESPYLFPNLHFVRWTRCSSINIESDERCEIKREYISTRELSASLGSLHRSRPVPYDLSFSFSPSSLSTPPPPLPVSFHDSRSASARRGSRKAEICWLLQATEGRQRENGRAENEEREGTRPQRLRSARFYRQTCPRQLSNF